MDLTRDLAKEMAAEHPNASANGMAVYTAWELIPLFAVLGSELVVMLNLNTRRSDWKSRKREFNTATQMADGIDALMNHRPLTTEQQKLMFGKHSTRNALLLLEHLDYQKLEEKHGKATAEAFKQQREKLRYMVLPEPIRTYAEQHGPALFAAGNFCARQAKQHPDTLHWTALAKETDNLIIAFRQIAQGKPLEKVHIESWSKAPDYFARLKDAIQALPPEETKRKTKALPRESLLSAITAAAEAAKPIAELAQTRFLEQNIATTSQAEKASIIEFPTHRAGNAA